MAGDYRLESLAVPESLDLLHDLLHRVAREVPEVDPEDLFMLETAVIEIANNVVEHGRPPGRVRYAFSLRIDPQQLVGRLSDSGEPLPERATPPSTPTAPPEVTAEDGRGIFLATAVLDALTYTRDDGRNVWHMVRRRRSGQQDARA